ncbi:phage tail tape measure protein [Clostridium sporogenes]|uniref:Phage tail tape measure protein n=1 Tax=Clostridium sporogenes TaxID=1509 RepID=A0AAE4JXB4_CLOSG|nr:phage tail tape measure protein [Clostridium sporogenes]MDS1004927.1 phage tail tape measure protein [Clostridium sporogenes]
MAKKEIYRLDIKIGVQGDSEAKKKLTATERFAKQTEKRTKALDKIKASPSVRLKDKLSKPLEKMEGKLSNFSKKACSKLAAIATAGALMIGGLGVTAAVRDFSNFEQGLANVKAISGATAQEMQVLGKEARRLGAETAWSAKDVTDAEMLLSQAGFKVQETIAALPGLLDMASAGDIDLAQATDIAAGTLRAFGMEAKKTTHVADVLAYTAAATNSDISGIGESMKYVAPVSKALGISFEETSAAIGMLADANIKGSQAGTVLRASFARLSNPSEKAAEAIEKLGFKAFDSNGKMLPLSQVIGNLKTSMNGLTKQQQAQAVSTIFGTEAMSGMMALIEQGPEKLQSLTKELEGSDGAARKMAETRLDSLQGQMTILKSAVEGMNIELGEKLAPYAKEFVTWFTAKIPDITQGIVKVVEKISSLAKKFNSLGTGTKKMFAAVAIGAVVFNPLTKYIKGTTKALTFLIGLSPKLSTFFGITKKAAVAAEATEALATGTGLAAKGVGGLGLAAKGGALLLNPWTWGIGAATYAGVKLYKHLKKDSIPEVQRFGDEVSKSTQKSVGAFMDLEEKATKSLNQLKWSGANVSSEIKNDLSGTFNEMTSQITTQIDENNAKGKQTLQSMFANSKAFSDKEKQTLISNTEQAFNGKSKKISEGNAKIQSILSNAASQNRQLRQEEYNEILRIKSDMMTSAVQVMSKGEAEQGAILERLKTNSGIITAQQAADVVKNSLDQKNKTIASAQEEYNERLKVAAMLRDEGGAANQRLADIVVTEAERQLNESTQKAESMHTQVVEHAKQQAGEHAAQVEWETGQVKSNFDVMMDKIREFNALPIKEKVITITKKINSVFEKKNDNGMDTYKGPGSIAGAGKAYATGTNYATSGLHEVAEHGFEIVLDRQYRKFNGGEKVLNNKKSKKFLGSMFNSNNETEEKLNAEYAVAQPKLVGAGGVNVYVGDVGVENNFDTNMDVDEIIEETTKEVGRKIREAFKNIKK